MLAGFAARVREPPSVGGKLCEILTAGRGHELFGRRPRADRHEAKISCSDRRDGFIAEVGEHESGAVGRPCDRDVRAGGQALGITGAIGVADEDATSFVG